MLSTEWLYRTCDEITRRTGYLTKYIRLGDVQGVSLGSFNRKFVKRVSAITKDMEDCYPQLLGALLVCHASSALPRSEDSSISQTSST